MNYLVALTLPEAHEHKRTNVLSAALGQLAVHGEAELVSEESGARFSRRSGVPPHVFRLLRVAIKEPDDLEPAVERVERAVDAGNSMLRSYGLGNTQIAIYIQPPGKDDPSPTDG